MLYSVFIQIKKVTRGIITVSYFKKKKEKKRVIVPLLSQRSKGKETFNVFIYENLVLLKRFGGARSDNQPIQLN